VRLDRQIARVMRAARVASWPAPAALAAAVWLHLAIMTRAAAVAVPRAAPRLAPHGVIGALVLTAVFAGGFSRPEPPFISMIGVEQGHLTAEARMALGPRAADVQVRDSLVRPALSTTTLSPSRPRAEATTYTVQSGDTVWGIGARYNVGAYSVLWSNGLDDDYVVMLQPGQQLLIPPVPGVVHTIAADDTLDSIARKYNVDPAVVVDFNELKPGEALMPDRRLIVPGGSLPIAVRPVAPSPPVQRTLPPAAAPRTAPAAPAPAPRTTQPQTRRARVPAPPPAAPTGRLSWPTRGVITTYFSGWHPGIDVAAPIGTNIAAADGGRVEFAGWNNWGYGYRVVVNHGNGYTTTYNHLSVISVRVGQQVGKGQQVGLMGSTGRSTGSHLHFEILRNGAFLNPLGVLG
jgi:murein DD-endopeptidase MepM/ murein hydrolase activator NlpD